MDVTVTCRDLSELLPESELACRLLFQECFKAGILNIFITETYRSQERQNYLYAQGRTRPGAIVTWTLKSNHSSRLAWDIAVAPPQDLYDVATLNRVGAIARKLNITWGGDWVGSIDRPHFEVKKGWKPPTGYRLEGTVIVPSNSKMKVQLIVKDKEETTMSNIWNPGSPSIQTEAEVFLAEAVGEEIIKKVHLEDLQNKKMTTDRLLGLMITIEQRRKKNKTNVESR